ncbi:MAG TPA: adenylate/guanylate cyclase domain-containing protein, partial [Leptospiraceae bacterium]|nr:adenylate/guanylate cyclase domain-containing protein [Leptospiraceae bacterium]
AQKEVLNKQITLSKSFARFVPFEMLEFLNRKIITEVELGDAVEKEMTVLFTDIRNYTSISEKFSPDENFRFLNFVLKDLGPIIRNHSGVIDKFIGDAIMALFSGSPDNAVQAAVQMKRQLKILNRNLVQMNFPPIDIGIGINTGKLILGTVGDEERMEATVISDTVNLASRIEGLTKHYHTEILLGEDSIRNLSETENYAFRLIDRVLVKGKKKPINLFEVIDFSDAEKSKCLQYKDQMEKTIRLFRERKFEKAKSEFQKMHRMNSEDRILVIYLERCRRYIKKPPASDWDGTNEMEFK